MIIQNPILTGSVALNGLNLTATNLATTSSNSFTSDQSITGSLGISANTTIAGTLTVTGSIVGLATSASYVLNAVSSSKAVSASYSDTASFANSFNVAGNLTASNAVLSGTLTAQTLVVQTITSSISYITGSTRFGSSSINTHDFTGSVRVSGSIGVGTTPNYLIEAYQSASTVAAARFANNQGDTVYIQGIGSFGGTIAFQQNTGSTYGTNIGYAGSIRAFEGSAASDNGIGLYSRTRMSFYQNSTTPVMNITGSNVGIGTNPAATAVSQLQIYGTSTIGGSNLADARLLLGTPTDGMGIDSNEIRSRGSALAMGTIDNFPVVLSSNSTNVLYVTGSNVGIGTATPTGLLDVASRGITKGSMPAGTVLQVIQTFKSDLFSIASGTPTDITGFSATITPTSSTSKILVLTTLHSASDTYPYPKLTLYRGSTAICLGTAGSNTTKVSIGAAQYSAGATPALYTSAQIFLDSPATTSSVTYKWQVYTFDAPNRPWYMNRTSGDTDGNNHSAPSTITLMEIAQ